MKIKLYDEEKYRILTFIIINKISASSRVSFLKQANSDELTILRYITTVSKSNKKMRIYNCRLRNYFFKVITLDNFTELSDSELLTHSSIEETEFSPEENIAA